MSDDTSEGQRVIASTRRADGTYRKERKLRDGYVPPDEQTTYMSRGKQWRNEADKVKCPGLDEEDTPGGLTKSQKKNAARKKRAATANPAAKPAAPSTVASAAQLSSLTLEAKGSESAEEPQNDAAAGATETDAGQSSSTNMSAEAKRLRALQKKMRQCRDLSASAARGDPLTAEQKGKLSSLAAWKEEVEELEKAMAAA